MRDLSHLASDPAQTRGREFLADEKLQRGPRSVFQRDRDRIVHSIAFRRLRHKTQVFVAPDGDHYRVRLTHSLEVAQVARTIARTLGLDEDLTEAQSLAHDIGHPPFGHAGEKALDEALFTRGGWDHNAQTLRTLMRLESPYIEHQGLNLTWESLEGLAKHNGPIADPDPALAALDKAYPLALEAWPSLEAQVAAISDDIAYDNHDIDDGLRAGFLDMDQLLALDFVGDRWRAIERRFPNASPELRQRELVRSQIGWMVNDVIEESRKRCEGLETVADVRAAGRQSVGFSDEVAAQERALKAFMYEALYYHPEQIAAARTARGVIETLYEAYAADPSLMAEGWRELPDEPAARARQIADFIAGMTDRYAITAYRRIVGVVPEGLQNV